MKISPTLVQEVRKYGNFDVNGCYNCGSCTITCDISSDSASFPRRSIQYALLGMSDPLIESLEPWLCQDCGDCSITCPHQAEPRESFASLRRYLAGRYDWTGLSSKIYRSKAWAIGTMVFTGLLVLILIAAYHLFILGMTFSDFTSDPVGFEHMFDTITYVTLAVIFIPHFVLISNGYRMYRFTMAGKGSGKIPPSLYLSEAKDIFLHVFTQKQMRKCPDQLRKVRWLKHLIIASGCALMIILLVFFLRWFQTDNLYPIYHPQRWLGYIATASLIYVSVDILMGKIKQRGEPHEFLELHDITFPVLLLLTALSGIAVHFLRYGGYELAAHCAYAIHLSIAVPLLIIELPFGKWAQMFFRILALFFQSVREKADENTVSEEDLEAA
ncbi:MAG: hypothetical protein GTO00_08020 [Deltaproteobacteria bacterium]|nr:hypothetical protein [Deltaproteobacteria bacterium]